MNSNQHFGFRENIFDDFIEFHGDRNFRDDKAVIGGIASIDKISVTVIGVNKGKNVKENTINIVKELNIEDKVVFTGYLKNPYNILKNAKLLIMSSSYEGFSMVLVEALALKTIPISTDCTSGPNEILIDELKDNLVPINNIKELSSKILEVINNYKKFDNLNYEKFIQKFEARKIANKYINLVNLFKKNN